VTNSTFDRDSWERRWEQALREHPDQVSSRPPNESGRQAVVVPCQIGWISLGRQVLSKNGWSGL
jgi:hypothetical protein